MDSTWDHSENEDKHLISHVAGIINNNQVPVFNNSSRKITSSDDRRCLISNGGSVSLDEEKGKHLATVVINNSNILSKIDITSIFNVDFRTYFYEPFYSLDFYIHLISEMCNSDPKSQCTCNCKCECKPETNGKCVCLCLCNDKKPEEDKCCICVCKNESKKCICICICKNKENCCCGPGTHQCNQCLVKVDIGALDNKTLTIIHELEWIEFSIPKSNEQCGSIIDSYKSIVSKIESIELLFKQISQEISGLIKLKSLVSSKGSNSTKCPKCPGCSCKEKIDTLIRKIEKTGQYYSLFESRINDIRPYVEYKLFNPYSRQISSSLGISIKCLLDINRKIYGYIINKPTHIPMSNKLLLNVYCYHCIFQSFLYIYLFLQSSLQISLPLYIIQGVEYCQCVKEFQNKYNNNKYDMIKFYEYLLNLSQEKRDDLKKWIMDNDGNHFCICIVIKYILYPIFLKSLYYLRYLYLESLTKQTREFIRSGLMVINVNCIVKMIYQIIIYLNKFTLSMKNKFTKYRNCYCRDVKNPYYSYLVSIILYLSSLIENIWAMDNREIVTAIQSLSSLFSELRSYDFTNIAIRQVRCNKVCGIIVDKKCPKKTPENCCWCEAIGNLLLAYIYLCFQFRFYEVYKALCKKSNDLCNKIKTFCEITELDCKCQCPKGKNGVCCLLKLSLCSKPPKSCEELEKSSKECCESCGAEQKGCCKQILEKLGGGGDLLVIGCNCEPETQENDVKAQCVMFNNSWGGRSAAIVILCKCKKPPECCCLTKILRELKEKLNKLCEQCICQQLKGIPDEICKNGCCGSDCQICNGLKEKLTQICKDDCLCAKIKKLEELCNGRQCQFTKLGDKCCRCVCSKVMFWSVGILRRACKLNVLEPYKRITLDLLSGSKDNHVKRMIVNSINNRTVIITYLLKNNYSTHFNTYTDHKNIANRFPSPTMGYGYDTVYKHQVAVNSCYMGINGIREDYTNSRSEMIPIRNKL